MNAVNLIPSEGRKRRLSVSTSPQTLGLFAGLALILAAAVFYVTVSNKVSSRKSELAKVTAGVQQWQTAGNSYAPFVQTATERIQDLAVVRQLAGTRYAWSRLLSQIGDVMPKNASLNSLQATTSDGATTGSTTGTTPAPTTPTPTTSTSGPPVPAIQLTGCAQSQSAVAQTLINLHQVKGVTDVTLSSSTEGAGASGAPASSGTSGDCKFPVQFQAAMTFSSGTSAAADGASAGTTTTPAATPSTTTSTPATTTSTPATTTSTPAATTSTPAASASAGATTTNSAS